MSVERRSAREVQLERHLYAGASLRNTEEGAIRDIRAEGRGDSYQPFTASAADTRTVKKVQLTTTL